MGTRTRSGTTLGNARERMALRLTPRRVLSKSSEPGEWDIIVVGGGATGLGSRRRSSIPWLQTLLLEAYDFAKGTSSRSTKLVHGGVRYLQQGNVNWCSRPFANAAACCAMLLTWHTAGPSSCRPTRFGTSVLWHGSYPVRLLAGRERLGRSRMLSAGRVRKSLPTLQIKGLKGGILYYDGQFDDARFAIALLRTLFDLGGPALNYARVTGFAKRSNGAFAESRRRR